VGGPPGTGVLIGRQAELAVLDTLIAQTAAGTGGVVLLAGDPGVGKTRLAREATQRAVGTVVSWGGCRESEGAPPLWPWLQVLRRLGGATITVDPAEGPAAWFAALPRDSLYLASLAILGEAAVTCRATDAARPILDALTPYASRNLIQGVPVGWGAAAWYIARLQWLLGRRRDAARSAATAQRLHRRWRTAALRHPLAGLGREAETVLLSRRESEVLGLLASGQANAEIGAALGVSVHTIERHVANIFVKIGARNRAEATAWAHRRGLAS
jgi:DNA-binding CsgD family transcriptional regulator